MQTRFFFIIFERKVVDFIIEEHFPDVTKKARKYLVSNHLFYSFNEIPYNLAALDKSGELNVKASRVLFLQEFFSKVVAMTAELIAKWQSVGFAHGKIQQLFTTVS